MSDQDWWKYMDYISTDYRQILQQKVIFFPYIFVLDFKLAHATLWHLT